MKTNFFLKSLEYILDILAERNIFREQWNAFHSGF